MKVFIISEVHSESNRSEGIIREIYNINNNGNYEFETTIPVFKCSNNVSVLARTATGIPTIEL
jgi:hypothetical protein